MITHNYLLCLFAPFTKKFFTLQRSSQHEVLKQSFITCCMSLVRLVPHKQFRLHEHVLHVPHAEHVPLWDVVINVEAPANMSGMSVTLDTSHFEMSSLNVEALVNMPCMLDTLDTSHFDLSSLNIKSTANMIRMPVTLDTYQFEMSLLNAELT